MKTISNYGRNVSNRKRSLRWVKVNDVTHKLTEGQSTRTPSSHGHWAGYETERAIAWAFDRGWVFGRSAWYARVGKQLLGPTTLPRAKAAALAMVNGKTVGRSRWSTGSGKGIRGPHDVIDVELQGVGSVAAVEPELKFLQAAE
jgi:hypothetical protein